MNKHIRIISILLLISLMLQVTGCGENNASFTGTGFYFDTVINFCFYGKNASDAIDACIELASEYDNLWNKSKETSDISRINASPNTPVTVDERTIELLTLSLSFAEKSNGAVTPAIGAVSSLWDFKTSNPVLPDAADISASLNHIDYRNIIIEGNTVTLTDSEAKLDPGFIAKGFAADKMKELAESMSVSSGWINLGGNVLVIGSKPDGSSFNIGIQNPENGIDGSITTMAVKDESVVTSGVYERCFEIDGVKYYHILDTKTGYPVRNNLLSVSVIGPSSAICDGLSTTLFVLGIEDGNKFLEQYPEYRALYITDTLELIYSTDTVQE